MSKYPMYSFTFSKPVEFKRVYNFLSPFAPTNNFWIPYESSKYFLASTKSETKNTLVKILNISSSFKKEQYYDITLIGDISDDSFVIQKKDIGELLKLFDIV